MTNHHQDSYGIAHYDIAIIGAGLVGATLALQLAQNHPHLHIGLVEANGDTPAIDLTHFDPKVVALNRQSKQLYQTLGIWQDIVEQRACPYFGMNVWDGEGTGEVSFDAADVHQQELGHIVENRVILRCLYAALKRQAGVSWMAPETVKTLTPNDQGVCLTLGSEVDIQASAVIGADGAKSAVRALLGVNIRQWSYGQSAIVTTVKTQKPHNYVARQSFTDHGPLAFLPLIEQPVASCGRLDSPKSAFSSIVWSVDNDRVSALEALSDGEFCQALTQAFESRLGPVEWVDTRYTIALNQMHVTEYAKGSVTLVGDAAHTIHPLAGQGVNVGLRDVKILSKELSRALKRAVPLNQPHTYLRYARQVQPHNLAAMAVMEGFKRSFGHSNPWLRVARNQALRVAESNAFIKRQLVEWAAGA